MHLRLLSSHGSCQGEGLMILAMSFIFGMMFSLLVRNAFLKLQLFWIRI